MAITALLDLKSTGLEIAIPVYVSLQNITLMQLRDLRTGVVAWKAKASVYSFASREAKYAGKEPVNVALIESAFVPGVDGDVQQFLYALVKTTSALSNCVDV